MRIISAYILREFVRILALTMLGFVLVFLVVDFLDTIDNFIEARVPLIRVGYYYLMMLPAVIFHLAPVAVLVAVLISLGLLAKNSEIVALKAGGVSLIRLSIPIFLAALFISVLLFAISDTLIPYSSARVNQIWKVEVEKRKEVLSSIRKNVWLKGKNGIYNFRVYDEQSGDIRGVSLYYLDKNFKLTQRVEAGSALPKGGRWRVSSGLSKTYFDDGHKGVVFFKHEFFDLPKLPDRFAQVKRSPEEMSFAELSEWVRQMEAEGYDALRYRVDLQLKASFPFICTIMALIGLPLAFWREKGGGIALGIGAGIGLSFIYIVFLGLSRSLGYSGLLPPLAAAWLPNLIFILLGFFLSTFVRQ